MQQIQTALKHDRPNHLCLAGVLSDLAASSGRSSSTPTARDSRNTSPPWIRHGIFGVGSGPQSGAIRAIVLEGSP